MRGEGTCAALNCRIAALNASPNSTREFNHTPCGLIGRESSSALQLTKVTSESTLFACSAPPNSYY
jgi:hypothetical protein